MTRTRGSLGRSIQGKMMTQQILMRISINLKIQGDNPLHCFWLVRYKGSMAKMANPCPLIQREKIDDSAAIEYLLYEGSGPIILFLHGTGFLPWTWHPIARRLNKEYRIIVPFFCDHRTAEPEEGGLKWKILADDLCEFCHLENP